MGQFDFKFNLSRLIRPASPGKIPRKVGRRGTIVPESRNGSAGSRRPGITREATQTLKLSIGPFVLSPGYGTVPAGGSIAITVEGTIDQPIKFEEFLAIDIPDRNTQAMPGGLNYKILAEGAVPAIDCANVHGIFEEHRIVHSIDQLESFPDFVQNIPAGGIFGHRDNKFKFQETIIGKVRSEYLKMNSHHG